MTIGTMAVHALCTAGLIAFLRTMHAGHWAVRTTWTKVAVISVLVLAMFLASVLEASIWAAIYVFVDAIQSFEEALYFSVVTFTTLGYGDITVSEKRRLLASLEAAGGTIAFG